MPLSSLTLQSQRLRLVSSVLLLLVSGTLILAHFKRAPSEAATMVQGPQAPIQAELITVTPTGFEPSELTRPQVNFSSQLITRVGWMRLSSILNAKTPGV